MCGSPSMPKQYEASAPVNGTWTPVKAYTQAEQDAIMAKASKPTYGVTSVDDTGEYYGMRVDPVARRNASQQIADRNGVAAADAQKLATVARQSEKMVAAPRSRIGATGGGGPTSLITGGTASAALATRRAPTSTLLGG